MRLRIIGDRARFDPDIQRDLAAAEARDLGNTRLNLTVALSYGARAEIAAAARTLAEAVRDGQARSGADRRGPRSPALWPPRECPIPI